jgi:phosphoglucomutase
MATTVEQGLQTIDRWSEEGHLSKAAAASLRLWLTDQSYAAFVPEILDSIRLEKKTDLEDQFRKTIEFGTGGIRGTMGPGPNRINVRTIGEAAQGLAQYVLNSGGPEAPERGVAIAYDTRHNSDMFARETASIMAGNGIRVHLFDAPRSTPQLSFAVRDLNAVAGVVISASHNPPSDNGFKAYWSDGGQVVPPHDGNIIAQVRTIETIHRLEFGEASGTGLIRIIDSSLDERYRAVLGRLTLADQRDVRLVYTPLHGVGMTSVAAALEVLGYTDLHIVSEQSVPDGSFPTVAGGVANPEDPGSFALAIRDAALLDADLALASDPDADRFGCAVPHPLNGWHAEPKALALTGNQIGAILCHYILDARKTRGLLPKRGLVCETVVTTDLVGVIARSFGLDVEDNLLIGFKYIGATIDAMPEDMRFVYGTEESHGYLADSDIRDKEAATGVLLVECAAVLKSQGKTLRDYLDEIYRKYGYFQQVQTSTYRKGAEGSREIAAIMDGLRGNPPRNIGGHDVVEVVDRQTGIATRLKTGETRNVDGDRGNLLIYTFTEPGHTRVAVRPSGTEPKIKYYISASILDNPEFQLADWESTKTAIDDLADEVVHGMLLAADDVLSR